MDDNKKTELAADQLGEVAGGDGKPKQNFGKRTVNCSGCGAENELPQLISLGMKYHCSECGAELKI